MKHVVHRQAAYSRYRVNDAEFRQNCAFCAGIRCYGPGEDQRVLIPFRTPLTVIFGANGTGKTVKILIQRDIVIVNIADHH